MARQVATSGGCAGLPGTAKRAVGVSTSARAKAGTRQPTNAGTNPAAKNFMRRILSARRRECARALRAARVCVLAVAAAALGGCAWLDGKERTFMYRPTPGRSDPFAGL